MGLRNETQRRKDGREDNPVPLRLCAFFAHLRVDLTTRTSYVEYVRHSK